MHRIILYLANFSGKIESPFFATLLSLSLQQLLSSSYLKLHFKVPPRSRTNEKQCYARINAKL